MTEYGKHYQVPKLWAFNTKTYGTDKMWGDSSLGKFSYIIFKNVGVFFVCKNFTSQTLTSSFHLWHLQSANILFSNNSKSVTKVYQYRTDKVRNRTKKLSTVSCPASMGKINACLVVVQQYSSTSFVKSVHYLYGDVAAPNLTYPPVRMGVEQRGSLVCTKYLHMFLPL